MSRKERHSRLGKGRRSEAPEGYSGEQAEGDEQKKLPSRRQKFPSSIHKIYKWYFNLLFVLFIGLVVFLFWYGNKFTQ